MAALNDTDIVSALNEDAEHGFRLLMAKYKEGIDILSSVLILYLYSTEGLAEQAKRCRPRQIGQLSTHYPQMR